MVTLYRYSTENGEYQGTTKSGMPKGSRKIAGETHIAPPTVSDNECTIYENRRWVKKVDKRGTRYWLPNAEYGSEGIEITDIGVDVPNNASLTAPIDEEKQAEENLKSKISAIQPKYDVVI